MSIELHLSRRPEVGAEERDARGGDKHAGRWEDRARWKDPSASAAMPNGGHYGQLLMGRDKWKAGGYLKLPRGVHEVVRCRLTVSKPTLKARLV